MFEKVYIISLAEKKARQAMVQMELTRVGLKDYSFFNAVNGRDPDKQDLIRRLGLIEKESLPFFSPGHLGCLASHYFLWLQIYLSSPQDGWYLILEDDCRFHPSIQPDTLQEIWSDLPADAVFAKLHSSNGYKDDTALFSEPATTHWLKARHLTFSLMAYAVHTRAIKTLLTTVWKNHIDLFHLEGTYIAKRRGSYDLYWSNLYTSNGFFSQGICIPNNDTDSDTLAETSLPTRSSTLPLKQLMDGHTFKEGDMSIHLYDEVRPTGTCHVMFAYNQKQFTYTD
jgi:GR25 family glycosyltransferase involved in LPS biosynthesis